MSETHTKRNPPWTRDEHIVALDFYLKFAPNLPNKNSREIVELSEQLNALHAISEDTRYEKFRNPNGVYMKLMNLKRFDPSYSGVGLAHGNKDEEVVWQLYGNKRRELSELALAILTNSSELTRNPISLPQIIDDEIEYANQAEYEVTDFEDLIVRLLENKYQVKKVSKESVEKYFDEFQ